ncbi:unnamed protein product [Rotaria sordida]|uniref:Sodium/hydrogen exchanger n=1 Tax=Rotaria sordida TaxID=392033 RepID=A0A813SH98_9BILA|nr:unnamed protein product [Rotaria sordida]CAF3681620.1 unnamed protein product [Rotaria sordida]
MKEFSSVLVLISYAYLVDSSPSPSSSSLSSSDTTHVRPPFPVVKITFDHVSNVFGICLWILLGILAKIVFHLSHRLTKKFPENCLLIILGIIVGVLLYLTHLEEEKRIYILNSDIFFLFLLPPIVLETGYFLPKRAFFDNLGTILLLAVLNKLFNTMCIGLTIWAFGKTTLYGGTQFDLLECLLFASFITAVDPIAVLATFVEIRVNDTLYIVVFGESLLNDAVTIVLYRMFESFLTIGQDNLIPMDFFLGFVSFFVVTIGGIVIGIIFGFMAVFMTKFTERTPVLEPLVVFIYAYIAYIIAEMTGLSGILAITICGMMMKQYVEYNITKKSMATIEYVLKMASSIMETIIFMFMGLTTVSEQQTWNTGFVIVTLLSCLIYRAIGVALFANLANIRRLVELTRIDMLIMSYGGLRGALAFALALVLDENLAPRRKEFITASTVVVLFTVFIQGTTLGPLVKLLNVRRKQIEEPTMSATLTNRMMDHVMTCLEDVAGIAGANSLRNKYNKFDHNYMKKWLLREQPQEKLDLRLWQTFRNIDLQTAIKLHEEVPGAKQITTSQLPKSQTLLAVVNPSTTNSRKASIISTILTKPDDIIIIPPTNNEVVSLTKPEDIKNFLDANMFDTHRRASIYVRGQDEIEKDEDLDPTIIHILQPSAIIDSPNYMLEQSKDNLPRQRKNRSDSTATNQLPSNDIDKCRF